MENNRITVWEIDGIDNPTISSNSPTATLSSAKVSDSAGHQAVLEDFINAVENDREPAVNGESAAVATEIILDIYQHNCS